MSTPPLRVPNRSFPIGDSVGGNSSIGRSPSIWEPSRSAMPSPLHGLTRSATGLSAGLGTNALRGQYVELCNLLERGEAAGFERWDIFVAIADRRAQLRQRRVPHSRLAIEAVGSVDFSERVGQLIRAVVQHFGDRRLDQLVCPQAWTRHGIDGVLDNVINALSRQQWSDSYARVTSNGGTRQEDVLLQELKALGEVRGAPRRVGELIESVQLVRARDNAVASMIQLTHGGILPKRGSTRLVASVGSGLAQFEELIAQSGARVIASDVEARPDELEAQSSIEFVRREASEFVDGISPGSVGLIILKDSLHHLPEPDAFLYSCRDKLDEGGGIVVVEPVFRQSRDADLRALEELDVTPYKSSFHAESGWEKLFCTAGFEIVEKLPLDPGVLDNNDGFPRYAWRLRVGSR